MTAVTVLHGIGASLRESFFMFWETLWALISPVLGLPEP
jgi:hypothetical protein